ncbi:hypothetical protein GCK32_011262 [Trichostrongylus colubriformis]|uniref:Secreted protein n=1 Tax=Trichostrongylus colubriformis TaxID=6319 RepID=A0AAN8IJY6_TRICO
MWLFYVLPIALIITFHSGMVSSKPTSTRVSGRYGDSTEGLFETTTPKNHGRSDAKERPLKASHFAHLSSTIFLPSAERPRWFWEIVGR